MRQFNPEVPTGMRGEIAEIVAKVGTRTWSDDEIIAHAVQMADQVEKQRLAVLEESTDDDDRPVYFTD